MTTTRRTFVRFQLAAGLALWRACRRAASVPFGADDLATLAAAAEALIPEDGSPGADAAWARDFIERRVRTRPELGSSYATCARALRAQARKTHGETYSKLGVIDREAVLRAVCPSVADDPSLPASERAQRLPLREVMRAFFCSDRFGLDDPSYRPQALAARDVGTSSPTAYSLCRRFPDAIVAKFVARYSGAGEYNRAWAAAGFSSAPGVCKSEEDVVSKPRGA